MSSRIWTGKSTKNCSWQIEQLRAGVAQSRSCVCLALWLFRIERLRSWVLFYWGDVIYDEPYSYEDRGGDWSRIKKRRLSRIQMENRIENIKYMRTRTIDLAQLYIFFRNRGWNTMTEEEYNLICDCNCDLDLYSNEKKDLLKYLKERFKDAWENKRS